MLSIKQDSILADIELELPDEKTHWIWLRDVLGEASGPFHVITYYPT